MIQHKEQRWGGIISQRTEAESNLLSISPHLVLSVEQDSQRARKTIMEMKRAKWMVHITE